MKTYLPVLALVGMLGAKGSALAQDTFQLPPECSDRQNPNPEKCVIQDGPPRAPWVHSVPPNPALKPIQPLPVPPKPPAQTPPSNFNPPQR
jgi:hypothetical protein